MLNIAYTHAIVVLVIFHYYMLQNKQSNCNSLYTMTSVICTSYKVDYLDKERSYKNSTKEVLLLFYLIFPIKPSKC